MQYLANVQGVPIQNELASPIDCKGKDFYCVDSKQFLQCFDVYKNGQTQTTNNKAQPCAGPMFCDNAQQIECTSKTDPSITTTQSPAALHPTQSPATQTSASSGK